MSAIISTCAVSNPCNVPGKRPSKADKENKKNMIAVTLLKALGDLFIDYRIEFHALPQNREEYCFFNCKEYKNGNKEEKFVGFHLATLRNEMITSAASHSEKDIKEAKDFAMRMEKLLNNPKLYTYTSNALTVVPALLAVDKVEHLSDSMFFLDSIIETLNNERNESPEYFSNSCIIQ